MAKLGEIVEAMSFATSPSMAPEFGFASSTVSVGNGGFTVADFPASAEAMPLAVVADMEAATAAAAAASSVSS